MEDKNELVSNILAIMRRIIDKHTLVDEMPMTFERDVVLTPREIRAIDLIGTRTEINVTDVGNHFRFTKSAASQLVTRLVKRGMVEKDRSPHNSKEYLLSLTSEGVRAQQVYQKFHETHVEDLRQRLNAFSMQQVSTTSVMLEVVESVVDERLKDLE